MNEFVFTTMRHVFVRFLEEMEDTTKLPDLQYENKFTKSVSISKNVVFYAFLVVRIY